MPNRWQGVSPSSSESIIPKVGQQPYSPAVQPQQSQMYSPLGMSVLSPAQRQAEQAQRDRFDAAMDQHNQQQSAVRDMRGSIYGVPGAQTPQGYAAPLANNGSQVSDYTGQLTPVYTAQQAEADANRQLAMQNSTAQFQLGGNSLNRLVALQRARQGGGSMIPQSRAGQVVMRDDGRFMQVPPNAIPVNNSMAGYQPQEGGYSERVQDRASARLAAQGFTSEEDQNAEMARRRAAYMADVNNNSERSRQMRRAERMGLIPRGTATPVRGRAESGSMIPSVKRDKNDVAKLGDSAEPEVFDTARPLPGLDQNASDVVRVFDEQNDMDPDQAKEFFQQTATALGNSASDMFDAMVKAAARSKFGFPDEPNEEPNKVAQEESRTASEKASSTYRGTLSKQQQDKFDKDVEKEMEKLQTTHKKKHDIHKGTIGRRTPSLQGGFGGVFYPTY